MSHFDTLNAINVNDLTEKKDRFTYLSWAWAWGKLMERYPDSAARVYENENGWPYHTDGRTAWVKCGVTVEGQEAVEYLPIMDRHNNSIPLEYVTSRNVSDTIQRCITKAIARHGLGLYIYAGEDLPEEPEGQVEENSAPASGWVCYDCGAPIEAATFPDGKTYTAQQIASGSYGKYGVTLCAKCYTNRRAQDGNESG